MKLERINSIKKYLIEHETASLDKLCEVFNVSKNTIRRDVAELESLNIVKKVYGGVTLNRKEETIPFQQRKEQNVSAKTEIGRLASELIQEGDIIFIDSGSTTVALIPFLKYKENVTVVTHSLSAINEVSKLQNLTLISTGGFHQRKTNSFAGISTIEFLKNLNISKAFMATTGVSIEKGVTNTTYLEAEIKKTLIEISETIILMSDKSKFEKSSFMRYCDLDQINYFISDEEPPQSFLDYFKQHSIICKYPE
ncbi:DeoR/GlpR transcriptional regulator [Acidaminobacter sp. JC074]|uniref:DeoR/GlpR family DNA-binding transcription regulator n=1 Tax=Acidaminobacter sp. JC074 TaxID=2530199 RepID=UPI001F0D0EC3|nr:DeoR/GlpR family DNA-binding transcription regulator [Acidaminobacter sp. JC074]MCH4889825.1 DeoR/GlpR transcriptional regulator [Acidaminobacter sp. JC074]